VDDSVELHQYVFSIQKLATLHPSVFSILGDDFAKELTFDSGELDPTKLAAILPTLPRPDKIVLEEHIASVCG
jgi:hypothetical protein